MQSSQLEVNERHLESLDNLILVERLIIFNSVKRQDLELMEQLINFIKKENEIDLEIYKQKFEKIILIIQTYNIFYSYFDTNIEETIYSILKNDKSKKALCQSLFKVCFTDNIESILNYNSNQKIKFLNIRKKVLKEI